VFFKKPEGKVFLTPGGECNDGTVLWSILRCQVTVRNDWAGWEMGCSCEQI